MVGNPNANLPVPAVEPIQTSGETFQINIHKHFITVVTLSIYDNINMKIFRLSD